jgi:hypothetical protein
MKMLGLLLPLPGTARPNFESEKISRTWFCHP